MIKKLLLVKNFAEQALNEKSFELTKAMLQKLKDDEGRYA